MADSAHIGKRIYIMRMERGLTQLQLAERSGLTAKTIGRIERGRAEPHPATITVLARALGCSEAALTGERAGPTESEDKENL